MTPLSPLRAGALVLALLGTVPLSACIGPAIGAGAAAGVAAYQERGIKGAAEDLGIKAAVFNKWLKHDHALLTQIGAEVYGGRVLLTGVVDSEKTRSVAVRLTWSVEGVKEVLNEIQLGQSGVVDFARDSWVTAQLHSDITLDERIYAINYAIETVNRVIYLVGVAQDQAELDRVVAYARNIKYVRKIISHVRLKDTAKTSREVG